MNGSSHDSHNATPANSSLTGFVRRVMIVVGVVFAAAMAVVVLWFSIRVWLLLFAGVLLAILLRSLSQWVRRWTRLPGPWSLAAVIVLLCVLGGLAGWLMAPRISKQVQQLSVQLPQAFKHVKQEFQHHHLGKFLPKELSMSGASALSNQWLASLGSAFSMTFEAVAGILVILFTAIYAAANPALYVNGLVRLFPPAQRERVRFVIHELIRTLHNWMVGQFLSMTVVGVLIGVGLHFLGIPLALSLGILAGLLDCIPIAGPILSAAPTVLLAFVVSPLHALYVIGLYILVIAVIESHVLLPLVQRFAVALPQVVTIIAMVLMWMLFGFLGVLLATPSAATALVLIRTLYVEDILGDRPEG